jgi:predicted SpoU family rRNA methylase
LEVLALPFEVSVTFDLLIAGEERAHSFGEEEMNVWPQNSGWSLGHGGMEQ